MSGSRLVFVGVIAKQVFPEIFHADLSGVVLCGVQWEVSAADFAGALRPVSGAVEGEWKAPQHGRNNPSCMSFIQQHSCGSSLDLCNRPAGDVDFIELHPCFGVTKRSHGVTSMMAARALGAANALGPCGAACGEKLAASLRADDVELSARIHDVDADFESVKSPHSRYCGLAADALLRVA